MPVPHHSSSKAVQRTSLSFQLIYNVHGSHRHALHTNSSSQTSYGRLGYILVISCCLVGLFCDVLHLLYPNLFLLYWDRTCYSTNPLCLSNKDWFRPGLFTTKEIRGKNIVNKLSDMTQQANHFEI